MFKRIPFTCLLVIFCFTVQAQTELAQPQYPHVFKVLPLLDGTEPEWVQAMYSDSPNYYYIEAAFQAYYQSHPFEKSVHTQNFKYFAKTIKNEGYLQSDGSLLAPDYKKPLGPVVTNHSAQNETWTALGPMETFQPGGVSQKSSQVNIYTFDQCIAAPNILYAGAETGGVYKSTDKGLNWYSIGDQIFDDGGIRVIRVDPINADIVYVGLRHSLLKSTDGGMSWSVVLNQNNLWPNAISIHPSNNNILYMTGDQGLMKSTDGGTSWSTLVASKCWDVKLQTNNPDVLFVMNSDPSKNITQFIKSTDAGASFTVKDNGWFDPIGGQAASEGGARMAVTDADANRIYVILLGNEIDYATDNNYIGIYRSDDAGESWSTPYDGNGDGQPDNEPGGPYSENHWCFTYFGVNSGGYDQGFYNLDIAVSDSDPDKLMVGALNLFKSEDGGTTYTRWGGYGCTGCGPEYRHPDIQEIEMNGSDLWVCSDGGIDQYDSNLDFVSSRNKGINGSDYWGFDQGWNHDVLVGGRYHNGNAAYYEAYDAGEFLSLGGAESATGYVNKGENRKVYHSDISGKEIPDVITGAVNNIPPFTLYPNESYVYTNRSELVTDPRYWNVMYIGKDNNIWKSENGGASFEVLKNFGLDGTNLVKDIEVSRQNPYLIFATQKSGNNGILWKSVDGGVTWNNVIIPANNSTMYIALNEQHELFLAMHVGGSNENKVFKSDDLGASWTNITSAALYGELLENMVVQEGTDGGVYLSSRNKIWYRNNSTDWVDITDNLPIHTRIIKILPFYRDSKVRIASNRGIWERAFTDASMPQAQPMVSHQEVLCDREIVQFEDYSILDHTDATWEWSFPGAATVSSYTARNPQVTYEEVGNYEVSLTVTTPAGSSTKTISNMVQVSSSLCSPEEPPLMAAECTATGDYLVNASVNETGLTEFTFTGWVKPNGIQADYSGIFSLSNGEGANKNVLNFREGNNTLGFHWNGAQWWWDSNLIVPADEWSFVAITVTANAVTLYVNESEATLNMVTEPYDLTAILMGTYYYWNSRNYVGLLEEATFWKRALTKDEIRLSRHLTKQDLSDPDLICYYQFNHNANNVIFDKKGTLDLSMSGNTNLVPSDAPVGPGFSDILEITEVGNYAFPNSQVQMSIDHAAAVPNGKVVLSRINILPSSQPSNFNLDEVYWIANNYGTNQSLLNLEQIQFDGVPAVSTANDYSLYNRLSNDGITGDWLEQGTASSDSGNESMLFDATSYPLLFNAQYFIGADELTGTLEQASESLHIYPNPVSANDKLYLKGLHGEARLTLYNTKGKVVLQQFVSDSQNYITLSKIPAGQYFYAVQGDTTFYRGKLTVK